MKTANKIFWGVFFVLAAVFVVVSKLGFMEEIGVFSILCAVFLVAIIVKSTIKLHFSGIFFPLAFLAIIFDEQLAIEQLTPWTVLLAALLLTIGCSTLFGKRRWRRYIHRGNNYDVKGDEVWNNDGSVVHCEKSFGDSINYVNADNFERADVEISFGAMKLYFDNAVIQKERAYIDVDVNFGSLELYIPKEWKVEINCDSSFGSVNEKNASRSTGTPEVIISGDVSFGSLAIIYV